MKEFSKRTSYEIMADILPLLRYGYTAQHGIYCRFYIEDGKLKIANRYEGTIAEFNGDVHNKTIVKQLKKYCDAHLEQLHTP